MASGEAVACATDQHELGEGARWDARRDEFLRIDIPAGRIYRDTIDGDGDLVPVRWYELDGSVGSLAPVADDDGWLVSAGRGFVYLSPDGAVRPIDEVAPAGVRMNDGACDPQGRFWAGTMAEDHRPGGGALYRLGRDGRTEQVLDGLSISNGLGWSPDETTMYLADSGPGEVYAFAFDPDSGAISDRRALVSAGADEGSPDGLTVDSAGDLWVALYNGGRVNRYSPGGELREVLRVPAVQTTSCAFAGPGLSRLYVTTATEFWNDEQRAAEPSAGLVYRFETDATGRPAETFRPDAAWWRTVTG
jgi:sugar lactone lactonase YvrE